MKYFKNTELANLYNVSEKSVRNWIASAEAGRLDLGLIEENGKPRIANTTKNIEIIEKLVGKGRKFRNTRGAKEVSPKPEFYKLYNQSQILDIVSNIDIYREIPFQYGYFDGGATFWDKYAHRLASEKTPNFLNSTVKLLDINQRYLDDLLKNYTRVNIIDVGVGNTLPLKDLLQHLLDEKKLGRYIAVDISSAMLKIAKKNVTDWFGPKVEFEGFEGDINHDRFRDLLAEEMISESGAETINLVCVLGGTLVNLRNPDGAFRIIHDSMNRQDLMILTLKLDTEATRNYFDFGIGEKLPPLDAKAKMVLDLLNIDESFYDVEMGFDPELRERYMRIRLKVALTVHFTFEKGQRRLELNKNEAILLWRYWHQNVDDVLRQLGHNEFDVLQSSQTEDKDYLLTVSRVKSKR